MKVQGSIHLKEEKHIFHIYMRINKEINENKKKMD